MEPTSEAVSYSHAIGLTVCLADHKSRFFSIVADSPTLQRVSSDLQL